MEVTTNNYVEAAHRRLHAEFGMDHPTILKFIDGIRGVHKGRDCLYEQFVRGDHSSVKWRKYVATYVRIRRIVESYNKTKHYRVVYLKGLSHNFLMER